MKKPGVTKEGQILIFEETVDSSDFLLADFDIDDATLKLKHRAFLDDALAFMARKLSARKAVPNPATPAWKVSFDGFASHTGSREHNLALSAQRERAVQDFLSQGTQFKRRELFNEVAFDPHFHGFDETPVQGQDPKKAGEDSLRRSVRVVIHPPDRPPRPRPIPVVGSTTFRVTLLRAVSGGFGLTEDNAFLEDCLRKEQPIRDFSICWRRIFGADTSPPTHFVHNCWNAPAVSYYGARRIAGLRGQSCIWNTRFYWPPFNTE